MWHFSVVAANLGTTRGSECNPLGLKKLRVIRVLECRASVGHEIALTPGSGPSALNGRGGSSPLLGILKTQDLRQMALGPFCLDIAGGLDKDVDRALLAWVSPVSKFENRTTSNRCRISRTVDFIVSSRKTICRKYPHDAFEGPRSKVKRMRFPNRSMTSVHLAS